MPKNPRGFPDRLRALMAGRGWNSRDVNRESEGRVSHTAVESWLKDEARAGDEQVEIVAGLVGWTVPELLDGHPGANPMTRLAELEGALGQVRRGLELALAAANRAVGGATTDDAAAAQPSAVKSLGKIPGTSLEDLHQEEPTAAPGRKPKKRLGGGR